MKRRLTVLALGLSLVAAGLPGRVAWAQERGAIVHQLRPTPETVVWGHYDAATRPVLSVESGDIVEVETVLSSAGYLAAHGVPDAWLTDEMRGMDAVQDRGPGPHILVGPVFVRGAEPGDVLEVRILDVQAIGAFGVTVMRPRGGTLPQDFPYPRVKVVPLDHERGIARFSEEIEIPMRAFFGSIGVAPPSEMGRVHSGPPGVHTGNMDNKELVAGSSLYMPVHEPGGLVFFGDGHAAQGDGEVAQTALESAVKGRVRIIVRKDMHLRWPRAETKTHYLTMGFDPDLQIAIRTALREMIDYLTESRGLSRDDAYMLMSMVADTRITQLVDGNLGIHVMLPKEIFVDW